MEALGPGGRLAWPVELTAYTQTTALWWVDLPVLLGRKVNTTQVSKEHFALQLTVMVVK